MLVECWSGRCAASPRSADGRSGVRNAVKVPGRTRWCQGRRARLGAGASVRGGRGGWENVTCGRSRSASTGPMPRTCCSASSEPNGPRASRSSTIRAARAGPMPGRRSRSSAAATSTSTGPVTTGAGGRGSPSAALRGARRRPVGELAVFIPAAEDAAPADRRRAPPDAMAESTWESCVASAVRASASAGPRRSARQLLTPMPSAATAATKSSAWRSPGVGTGLRYQHLGQVPHRRIALVMKIALELDLRSTHRLALTSQPLLAH